ncbi:MAG: sensor histidine kinase [Alphaproteobacteria bacterium]
MKVAVFLLLIGGLDTPAGAESARAADTYAPRVFFLEDKAGRMSLARARAAARSGRFTKLEGGALDVGFSSSTFWLRFEVPGGLFAGAPALIAAGKPTLDRIDVYVFSPGGRATIHRAGDVRAYRQRGYPHRNPLFPLGASPARRTVMMKIVSGSTINLRITLWRERAYLKADTTEQAFLGVYFGIIAALVIYNMLLFVSIRDRSYVYYSIYLGSVLLLQTKLYGFADQVFWPAAPQLANPATLMFFAAVIVGGIQFSRTFLNTRRRLPRLDLFLRGLTGLGLALVVAHLFLSYGTALKAMIGLALVVLVALTTALVLALRQGYGPARFVLYAFATLAVGACVYIARISGVLPGGLLVDHAFDLATAAEAMLLSFALAHRINLVTADKRRAEGELLGLQRRFSRRLLESQEGDRQRIAGELHDSIGQNLLVIANRLKRLAGGKTRAGSADGIAEVGDFARTTIDEVRAIAQNLRPHQLDRLGLSAALGSMVENAFRDSDIECQTDIVALDGEVGPDTAIHLYRVAQEAVNNVLKHSHARHATVGLKATGGVLELRVGDDGRGMDKPARAGGNGGFGITAMRERMDMVGGTLRIDSRPGAGTELSAAMPMGSVG